MKILLKILFTLGCLSLAIDVWAQPVFSGGGCGKNCNITDSLNLTSSTTNKPLLDLTNTTSDATPPAIRLGKNDGSANSGADVLGVFQACGFDDALECNSLIKFVAASNWGGGTDNPSNVELYAIADNSETPVLVMEVEYDRINFGGSTPIDWYFQNNDGSANAANDIFAQFYVRGYDTTGTNVEWLRVWADANWGNDSTDAPTTISLYTSPDGSETQAERFRVKSSGQVRFIPITIASVGACGGAGTAGDTAYIIFENFTCVCNGTDWVRMDDSTVCTDS